ncbi:MAG: hypothetical protein CSA65_09940 [Proteobacteria bacterium]|nr:MAG: hypothetical protein CSA65_09940 [Pseudomonadota bacterium]
MKTLWLTLLIPVLLAGPVLAGEAPPDSLKHAAPLRVEPARVRHQDSIHLGQTTGALLPADGLLAARLDYRTSTAVYQVGSRLESISLLDVVAGVEATPLPGVAVRARWPWRRWSGGVGPIPATGSGLADGDWQLTLGGPRTAGVSGALYGGGNIPLGGDDLGEGAFSPQVGAAVTWRFFARGQAPEMRLHLNLGYRWNRDEEHGHGTGGEGFQPWAPRYPAAAAMGGAGKNDQILLRAALEFRKRTTSLWVGYGRDRFTGSGVISAKEQFSALEAGLRWGVMEGWALHGSYLVSLIEDDPDSGWDPAFPEWRMAVGLSRQFGIGGRDRDGDGIVDRHDHCPRFAEDVDGFRDDDGCPDEDNDGDGIPDARDLAPDEAEDFDGFEDEDGKPEPDNDGDGILDRYDLCPLEPEDMDGHRDDDGCPDDFLDRDHDGVEDSRDACPDTPEDRDGYEDDDGCPDRDNDLDGVPDSLDGCPDEPEDYDGDADGDGCPE